MLSFVNYVRTQDGGTHEAGLRSAWTKAFNDYARNVKGVDVAFTVKYISAQETRVSLRSKTVDVNAIAAVFGGGGHVRAAGCTIYEPLLTAKKMVVKEIIGHK